MVMKLEKKKVLKYLNKNLKSVVWICQSEYLVGPPFAAI